MENVTNGVKQWKLPPNVGQDDEPRVGHIHPVTGSVGASSLEKQVGGNHYIEMLIEFERNKQLDEE